jgi:hypothetical protein
LNKVVANFEKHTFLSQVIKTCYNNGQKERLCLIIDKCRRQKLCKRAQKISAAAPSVISNPCLLSVSEHFEFRHFRPHYLDVDTIFGDLGVNVYIRNTIFRKAPKKLQLKHKNSLFTLQTFH